MTMKISNKQINREISSNGLYSETLQYDATTDIKTAIDNGSGSGVNPAPTAPVTNFTATTDQYNKITLSWTNSTDSNAIGVTILRKEGSYPTDITDTTAETIFEGYANKYIDYPPQEYIEYYYSIWTYSNSKEYNTTEDQAIGKTIFDTTKVPNGVTNIQLQIDTTKITLNWDNPTTNFSYVIIEMTNTDFSILTDIQKIYKGNANTYEYTNLTDGSNYKFRIHAYSELDIKDKADDILNTNMIETYFKFDINELNILTDESKVLLWITPPDGENTVQEVRVLRKEGSYPSDYNDATADIIYEGIFTNISDSNKYIDSLNITNGIKYYYKAWSHDTINNEWSTGVDPECYKNGTPDTIRVKNVNIAAQTTTAIFLQWDNAKCDAANGHVILRKENDFATGPNDLSAIKETLPPQATEFYDDNWGGGLKPETYYYYSIYDSHYIDGTTNVQRYDVIAKTDLKIGNPAPPDVANAESSYQKIILYFNLTENNIGDYIRIIKKEGSAPTTFEGTDPGEEILYDDAIQNRTKNEYYIDELVKTDGTIYYYAVYSYYLDESSTKIYSTPIQLNQIANTGYMTLEDVNINNKTSGGDQKNNIVWTYPTVPGLFGVKITYRTDGTTPIDINDTQAKTLLNKDNIYSMSGMEDEYIHTNLTNGQEYRYKIFIYDSAMNYSEGISTILTPNLGDVTSTTIIQGNSEVKISWTNPIYNFYKTKILRKQGSYPINITDGTIIYDSTGTFVIDTNLTNNTDYYYTIYAYNSYGDYLTGIDILGQPTSGGTNIEPNKVTMDKTLSGDTYTMLKWILPQNTDIQNILIRYKVNALSSDFPITSANETNNISLSNTTIEYKHTSLINDSQYGYSIYVIDNDGLESEPVNVLITPRAIVRNYGEVSNVVITATDNTKELTWTLPTDEDFVGVKLLRKTSGPIDHPFDWNATEIILTDPAITTSYIDTNLINGQTYYYAFYTYDGDGQYSTGVFVSDTYFDTTAPDQVTNVSSTSGNNEIILYWTNPTTPDYIKTRIEWRYDTAITGLYQGTLLYDNNGETTTLSGIDNDRPVYFGIFTYDDETTPNYSAPVSYDTTAHITYPPDLVKITNVTLNQININNIDVIYDMDIDDPNATEYGVIIKKKINEPITDFNDPAAIQIDDNNKPTLPDTFTLSDGVIETGSKQYYSFFGYGNISGAYKNLYTSYILTEGPHKIENFRSTVGISIGSDSVKLDWINPNSNFDGVIIKRSTTAYPNDPEGSDTTVYNGTNETVTDSGLTTGTPYYYTIWAYQTGTPNIYSTRVFLEATPSADDLSGPATLDYVEYINHRDGTIELNWTNPPDTDHLRIVVRTDRYAYNPNDLEAGLNPQYIDINPATETYTISADENIQVFLSIFTLDTNDNYNDPYNLLVSPFDEIIDDYIDDLLLIPGDQQIDVKWTNPVFTENDLNYVIIKRDTGTYPTLTTGTEIYNVDESGNEGIANTFTDINLTNGTMYYYIIWAQDDQGNMTQISQAKITPQNPVATVDAPTNFTISNTNPLEVTITWDNPATAFNKVKIYRRKGQYPVNQNDIKATRIYNSSNGNPGDPMTFIDTNLQNGSTNYYYRIYANDTYNNFSTYLEDNILPIQDTQAPGRPTNISVTNLGNGQVKFDWVNPTDPDFEYVLLIRREDNTDPSNPLGSGDTLVYSGDGTTCTDTGLESFKTYYYTLIASDEYDNIQFITTNNVWNENYKIVIRPSADITNNHNITLISSGPGTNSGEIDFSWSWNIPNPDDILGVVFIYKQGSSPDGLYDPTSFTLNLDRSNINTTITGLTPGASYDFVIGTYDEVKNISPLIFTTITAAI